MNTSGGGVVTIYFILNIGVLFVKDVGTKITGTESHIKHITSTLMSKVTPRQISPNYSSSILNTISSTKSSTEFLPQNSTSSISTSTSTSFSTSSATSVSKLSSSSPVSTSRTTSNASMSAQTSLSTSTMSPSRNNETVSGTITINSYSFESTTVSFANNSSTHAPGSGENSGLQISTGTALGIFVIISILVIVGSIVTYILKKKGSLSCQGCKSCFPGRRRRRSSTSSRGPLTQDDATFVNISEPPRQDRELFSIGDQDGGQDGRQRSMQRRGTEDDYFYDEIFGQSAFVDETTNKANTYLSVADDDDDDILAGLNIPDLVFKKPHKI